MVEAKTEAQKAADHPTRLGVFNTSLPYDPVVAALRVLARRGRQLREAEERAATQETASETCDELLINTHEKLD